MARSIFLLSLLCLLCLSTQAQTAPAPRPDQTEVAEKQIIAYTLPPDKMEKAEALYKLGHKFEIIGPLYSWLVLLAVLSWGIGARYRDWAEALSSRRTTRLLIFVVLFLITLAVTALPLQMYSHHIGLKYGLSVQSWSSWFADYGKGRVINFVIVSGLLWLLLTTIRKSPRRWWFYFWLELLPLLVIGVFLWPLLIDPLFNKFEPLENTNPQLVEAIETVVHRGGLTIPRDRIFEMKASEKVTTPNAYVTGLGASKRVVVEDTTIQQMSTPETLFVFGHEMGHYVLNHILYGMIAGAIGLLAALYILFHLSRWVFSRFGPRWRIPASHDLAAVPMFFLLYGILAFFSQPVANAFSRNIEHQADIYGLEVTHGINANSQQVAAHSFQVLGELSLDYPYPNRFEVFWYGSHPPIADRLRFALEYDPWDKGESPKYVKAAIGN